MVKDIVANNLTPTQKNNPKYKLGENASIPQALRSLVNVILRKNLGDAKVASYIFERGIPTVLDPDLLRHPPQGANMEVMLEELMMWHASLLQWLDKRQRYPNTIFARDYKCPLCGRVGNGGYDVDWLSIGPICTGTKLASNCLEKVVAPHNLRPKEIVAKA